MKYTKDDLLKMSDFEINKALAKLVCKSNITYVKGFGEMVCADDRKVDYCNNWNDIMPLAAEHGISLLSSKSRLISTATNDYKSLCDERLSDITFEAAGGIYIIDVSPQRAITCCLILVLQERE